MGGSVLDGLVEGCVVDGLVGGFVLDGLLGGSVLDGLVGASVLEWLVGGSVLHWPHTGVHYCKLLTYLCHDYSRFIEISVNYGKCVTAIQIRHTVRLFEF